jgi:hypothetical protein
MYKSPLIEYSGVKKKIQIPAAGKECNINFPILPHAPLSCIFMLFAWRNNVVVVVAAAATNG